MKNISLPRPTLTDYQKRNTYYDIQNTHETTSEQDMEFMDFTNSFDWSGEIFQVNDKCGLKTALGEMVLPAAYEDMLVLSFRDTAKGDRVSACHNGKWGVVIADGIGTWHIQPEYDYIGYPCDFTHVRKDNKWGVLNVSTGEYLIPPECDSISHESIFLFINGLAVYDKDGKTGVISSCGAFTAPEFDDVEWSEGSVKVKYQDKWGFINEENKFTTDEDEAYYACQDS